MFDAFLDGLLLALGVSAMLHLLLGVVIGLVVGLLPGLGGPVGLAVMLPFTFDMAPVEAFAFLLGMLAVTSTTSDITAIIFGVPGDAVSAALVMDGYPMAKSGQVGRALGASLASSLLGALIGALALALTIPFLRPIVLAFGSPELFMLALLGVTFVAALSEGALLKGLTAGSLGVMLSFVGMDSQTGVIRYAFGQLSLWDGVGLVAVAVGLFAVPEIVDLILAEDRRRRGRDKASDSGHGLPATLGPRGARAEYAAVFAGMRETLDHWRLLIRGSLIGVFVGIMPGLGGSVAQWVAYANAVQTSDDRESFGTGRIEGIIGPGAANNSKEGGSLIPTLAFGVPGSVTMAVLLGAFLIQGLTPGPSMLGQNLSLTMSMIFFIAFSNVIAVLLCLAVIVVISRITSVRSAYLVPMILLLILIGAFAEKNSMIDVWIVLGSGLLGLVMHRLGWPRPPLLLGLVLGGLAERYLFISVNRYGVTWLTRPLVIGIVIVGALGVVLPRLRMAQRASSRARASS